MDPSTVKLLFLAVPMLGVVVIAVMMVVLFIRSVLDEVSDESTRYSRLRREEYQDQRLNVVLRGLAFILVFVVLTPVLYWILF